jgi:hypothetical protein
LCGQLQVWRRSTTAQNQPESFDREWVEPEGLAQSLEVSRLRLVEVCETFTPAKATSIG